MPRVALTSGPVHTLVVGEIYALPGGNLLQVTFQGGTIEISQDGSTWTALPAGGETAAAFIRTTVANSLVTVRHHG